MKYLLMQSEPGLPTARIPVCARCDAFHQSPSPDCPEKHGSAHPREVLRQLCKVLGHALTAGGKSLPHCLRCQRPRNQVVS